MTLDKDDKKEIAQIVGQVVDAKVTPRLKKVEKKLDVTMEMCAKNTEGITVLDERFEKVDERFEKIDERFNDTDASLNRIETLAKSEIKYVDDLSKRVVKLETKSA